MDQQSKRRWFQMRLSTWLILVAIIAWAIAVRPWLAPRTFNSDGDMVVWSETITLLAPGGTVFTFVVPFAGWQLNPQVVWPLAALLIFLAWKFAWRLRERRRVIT
jgi:hypothetical protein